MKKTKIKKITICGYGLIGGCMALEFMKGRGKVDICAYDYPAVLKRLKKSRKHKVIVESSFPKAVRGSDIIVLSAYHKSNEMFLKKLAAIKDLNDCLIIDTGAVKKPIAGLAKKIAFPSGTQFLPTHPMAGREKKGFENAAAGLFKEHAWYLDEDVKMTSGNKSKLLWMIKKLKAKPVFISSQLHDELVSELSHLPQLISTILGSQVNPDLISLAGPGLKSMLRLAGSPYSVWSEIIDENRKEIIKTLRLYSKNLNKVIDMINNNESLKQIFTEAFRSYKCL
ncbi:MAG: prephenate dehydrogenase [Candidatus Zixiibacteriota bacterium]